MRFGTSNIRVMGVCWVNGGENDRWHEDNVSKIPARWEDR